MTEGPLCTFLMMRSDDGTWTVTVCRDFGDIMRTWKARKEPDRDVGVLHVGFDQPASHALDEIAGAHPGRMLLTASAKQILPDLATGTDEPVGIADNTGIFIGLRGWGDSLTDPAVRAGCLEPTRAGSATQEPQGWVAAFLAQYPSDAEALSVHGIHDDASYLERESGLERSARHRSGLFRAHNLVGIHCDDPCALAGAAPPWLAERRLYALNLPRRFDNVLCNWNIKTVQDLAACSSTTLLNLPGVGPKSLRDTVQSLNAALNEGPPRPGEDSLFPDPRKLLAEIRRSLLLLPDRERDILIRRLGFETPPETLRQIAEDYDVTGERIRQIEVRAKQKWIYPSYWYNFLGHRIARLLIGRRFPLPMTGAEAVDSWFEGMSSHLEFFKKIVQMACKDRIHFIEIDGLFYFSLMDQSLWERTVSKAAEFLSSGAGRGWSENYACAIVHSVLQDAALEFAPLLWDKVSRLCHFSASRGGSRIFTSYGRGAEPLVEAILAESDTPLHYTEIARRAGSRGKKRPSLRTVYNAAAKVGFLFGPGIYGLARHVPLSDQQISRIRIEVADIVCPEASGRQWYGFEILSELSERLEGGIDGLDKYLLDIALAKSTVLRPLGKMIWIRSGQDADDQIRFDAHRACVAFLKSAGHPLDISEIKEHLTGVRGINGFFHHQPVDPLVRIQPGVWGVNDRDVPLSREKQARIVEMLVQMLEEKHCGIHISELSGILPLGDCSPGAFLSIAAQDGRLKISQARYAYLAEWEGPRRKTIGNAVPVVPEKADKPLA